MLAFQLSIGTANDVADAEADARAGRTAKPVAAGIVPRPAAAIAALLFAGVGFSGALVAGPAVFAIAIAGYGLGIVYDLALKRTAWSWVPYALAVPLLPVFAWVGATGQLPESFLVLAVIAVPAGISLAISNALADAGPDRVAGVDTVAGRLGRSRSLAVIGVLDVLVATVAIAAATGAAGMGRGSLIAVAGAATMAAGAVLSAVRRTGPGWEVQAVGMALLAVGWIVAHVDGGLL